MMRIKMGYSVLPIFVLICCLCSISFVLGQDTLLVTIKNGTVQGSILTSRKGRDFASFRGIPFAKPPLGQLRFEPPQPPDSWQGIRSAQEDSNFCIQQGDSGSFIGSEDCLYLNVYRPKLAANDKNCKFPVMIFFYGGSWVEGSADSGFYGPQYLLDHDVVLVTVNYRLGSLGFLSTEDLVCPGNQGLKDQAQSIRWVHENIAAFNGDPNKVTIFGESSGASAVHFHMMNTGVRGLFHRAITESGDALNPDSLTRPGYAKPQAILVGKRLNCPTGTSSELVGCLKTKNANDVFNTTCPNQGLFDTCPIRPFEPVIEPKHPGAYISEEPLQTLKCGNVADIPWLTGFNAQEGAAMAAALYGPVDQHLDKYLDENFLTLAPASLGYDLTCPLELQNNVSAALRQFYFGNRKIDFASRTSLMNMYTDAWFFIGDQISVKEVLNKRTSPIYYYHFEYRGTNSFTELFGDTVNNYGVCHADELQYLFPIYRLLFPNSTRSAEDNNVIDVMTQLWVNFADTGNPTPKQTSQLPVKWLPVTTPDLQYLHIKNSTDLRMGTNLFPERVALWASLPYRANIHVSSESGCHHKKPHDHHHHHHHHHHQ